MCNMHVISLFEDKYCVLKMDHDMFLPMYQMESNNGNV